MTFQLFHHHLIRGDERISNLLGKSYIEGIVDRNFVGPGDRVGFAQQINSAGFGFEM